MVISNINLGENVSLSESSIVNNIILGDNSKISHNVRIFGSKVKPVTIGSDTYVGPFSLIEGYNDQIIIGKNVSIAQRVTLLTASSPNASKLLQKIFPEIVGPIHIGDHSWIGAHSLVLPNVCIEEFCIVGAHSLVKKSFSKHSIIGGTPAKLIRKLTKKEIYELQSEFSRSKKTK